MSGAGGEARRALLGQESLPWGPGQAFATMTEYMQARLDALDADVAAAFQSEASACACTLPRPCWPCQERRAQRAEEHRDSTPANDDSGAAT